MDPWKKWVPRDDDLELLGKYFTVNASYGALRSNGALERLAPPELRISQNKSNGPHPNLEEPLN